MYGKQIFGVELVVSVDIDDGCKSFRKPLSVSLTLCQGVDSFGYCLASGTTICRVFSQYFGGFCIEYGNCLKPHIRTLAISMPFLWHRDWCDFCLLVLVSIIGFDGVVVIFVIAAVMIAVV